MWLQIRGGRHLQAVDVLHVPVEVRDGDGCQVSGVDLDMVPGGELDQQAFAGLQGEVREGHGLERVRVGNGGSPKGSGDAELAALFLGLAWRPLDPQKDDMGLA